MVWQHTRPVWKSRSSVWEEYSGTLRMVCGGPGRRGRKGREPNWSHEWEGSQGCGGDRAKKHGGTLEQFEAIPLNYGG